MRNWPWLNVVFEELEVKISCKSHKEGSFLFINKNSEGTLRLSPRESFIPQRVINTVIAFVKLTTTNI